MSVEPTDIIADEPKEEPIPSPLLEVETRKHRNSNVIDSPEHENVDPMIVPTLPEPFNSEI